LERPNQNDEMLQLLTQWFEKDPEAAMLPKLARCMADPLKPVDEVGNFRVSPVVLVLAVLGLVGIGAFLYFGYWA
jgi:hypothetical protein